MDGKSKPQLKTEFIVSTKAELITEKVNKWIEEHSDIDIYEITPFMSYTSVKDKGSMMIGCMIQYHICVIEDSPREKNTVLNEEQ